ncbi:MAG: hypothetical protein ACYDAY_00535 [Candidatus Dormibacteria bacterium]
MRRQRVLAARVAIVAAAVLVIGVAAAAAGVFSPLTPRTTASASPGTGAQALPSPRVVEAPSRTNPGWTRFTSLAFLFGVDYPPAWNRQQSSTALAASPFSVTFLPASLPATADATTSVTVSVYAASGQTLTQWIAATNSSDPHAQAYRAATPATEGAFSGFTYQSQPAAGCAPGSTDPACTAPPYGGFLLLSGPWVLDLHWQGTFAVISPFWKGIEQSLGRS